VVVRSTTDQCWYHRCAHKRLSHNGNKFGSVDLLTLCKGGSIYVCVGVRFPGAVAVLSQCCRSAVAVLSQCCRSAVAAYPLLGIPCQISPVGYPLLDIPTKANSILLTVLGPQAYIPEGGNIRDNTTELLKVCGNIRDRTAELVQLHWVLFSYYCPWMQLCVEDYCHPGVYITALYSDL
jgi:hypothetical protein